MSKDESWLFEISTKQKFFSLNLKEIWKYRDLLSLFVKRDIVTVYKQTVLGPLWFFIQPLFTSVVFTLIFNRIASIDTGFIPSFLFNLAGITIWNYFKICLTGTASTFRANASMFGKVYFPRFIVPLSKVISNLVKFGIQMIILAGFYAYYFLNGAQIALGWHTLLFPLYIVLMAVYGLGIGMIISTFTTKYRDLSILLTFSMQLLMYLSAVAYPMSEVSKKIPSYSWVIEFNPIAHLVEGFRYSLFGDEALYFDWLTLAVISFGGILLFLIGLVLFNRTEKTFIDTV